MRQFFKNDKGFVDCGERKPGCWVNVEMPDREDMISLIEDFNIPASFLEALQDADERPRVDREKGWSLTVLRIPAPGQPDAAPFKTVPFGIISGDGIVLTVSFFESPLVKDFIAWSRKRELCITRPSDFILNILYCATSLFLTYLRQMERVVTGDEHDLERNVRNSDLLSLMRLQQSLVFFSTALKGNSALLERLHHVYGDDYDLDFYDDLEVEMKQADSTVAVYTEILESTMDAYGSIISNNVNLVMKRMTSITIILMVPTLVASFYGMNVKGLAFAEASASFYIVIVIALVLTVVTYLLLRHIKWF